MLIRFSVENFLSFKERVVFSMIPGRSTSKPNHKTSKVNDISILKTAVVFGANASGKSNLIKAISFGKNLILQGTKNDRLIDFQKFKLDGTFVNKNSRIEYEIQHQGKNYAYGFVFNSKQIVEEWLFEISSKNDILIFERSTLNGKVNFNLSGLFKTNKKEEHRQFLTFIAKGTPDNQLFLTEIRTRKLKDNVNDITDIQNILDWFQNTLEVVFPKDKYKVGILSKLTTDTDLLKAFEELLDYFDTGIAGILLIEEELEQVDLPQELLEHVKNLLSISAKKDDKGFVVFSERKMFFVTKTTGEELVVRKCMTKHKVVGQESEIFFDLSDESDGTNRIIDFIPLMIDLLSGEKVFVIDEMERSLHPNIVYDLFDLFLSKSTNINSQLITASHESSLLTQKLLRKDEIWFVLKNQDGASLLHSLEEYNVRFDKEIRKDYLLGRFKAIPRLGNKNKLTVLPN